MHCELPLVIPKPFLNIDSLRKLKMEDLHPRESCLVETLTYFRLKTVKWLILFTSSWFNRINIFTFEHPCFQMSFAALGY